MPFAALYAAKLDPEPVVVVSTMTHGTMARFGEPAAPSWPVVVGAVVKAADAIPAVPIAAVPRPVPRISAVPLVVAPFRWRLPAASFTLKEAEPGVSVMTD